MRRHTMGIDVKTLEITVSLDDIKQITGDDTIELSEFDHECLIYELEQKITQEFLRGAILELIGKYSNKRFS
jgi:hypothetical protein